MQAPGIYSYGAETIPAVHESLDVGDWSSAERGAVWTEKVLDGYCEQLDKLTRLLRGGSNEAAVAPADGTQERSMARQER